LFIPADRLPRSPGHVFYRKLNGLLADASFDSWLEKRCAPFYADGQGREGIPPGTYFRMLLVGYFEGIGSQRGGSPGARATACRSEIFSACRRIKSRPTIPPCPGFASVCRSSCTWLQGLRNRLSPYNVTVTTVKPGCVDTAMTYGLKKLPLLAGPERVAADIDRAILRRRSMIYAPRLWRPIMAAIRLVPEPIFQRMKL
ncbi:MAG TPA: hypothetical protein VN699_13225, partial [Pirellulales bacterium]|nr:hypothetical protein [Pirellulales bacterium]